ncbi:MULTISPECIES: NADPH-dependent FMN reductase [Sediminimonas]|uniref:NADPH-dependent FMN reductase n=1 Tax=Sediminimonas TaxID=659427 RepID=UPI000429F816|nr:MULTISPECIES: NAD(P)H-dependent oxidoreductase [Sediminimonas]MDR9484339.1 NAD(P)H-dependent oxidoreductase [Sediminimonas sp.]
MSKIKLLGMSGSLRQGSYNTQLLHEAERHFDGAEMTLADLNLPLLNQDIETTTGIPETVQTLADQIAEADAVVISTTEYNKGISGVLKNALDWISRTKENPLPGKPVAIMSAAAGRAGGERAQVMLRNCLVAFRPRLLQGPELFVAKPSNEFDEDGRLINASYTKKLTSLMEALRKEIP